MQISLTVQSEGYVPLSTARTQSFESTLIESMITNPESANYSFGALGNQVLTGSTMLIYQGKTYTVSESVATINALTGGGGATSEAGVAVTGVCSAVETSVGGIHKTVLTFENYPIEVVSVTTGKGGGNVKIYDFPAGVIEILGTTCSVGLAVETADEGDFTDAIPEGDFSIGTVADSNLALTATEINILSSTSFTMADYAVEEVGNFLADADNDGKLDGSATAKDAIFNILVDAADIDDDVTTHITLTGTVSITWVNYGDY